MAYMRMEKGGKGFHVLESVEDWKLHIIRQGMSISFFRDELDSVEKVDIAMTKIKENCVTKEYPTTPYFLRKLRKILMEF